MKVKPLKYLAATESAKHVNLESLTNSVPQELLDYLAWIKTGPKITDFCEEIKHGNLLHLMYIQETFRLTTEDARLKNNWSLRCACRNDHLEVAQWLTETFGLTAEDARADDNWALRWVCESGYLNVAQWLTERFGLTTEDARTDDNWALQHTRQNGHFAVAQWLTETFHI